MKYGIALGGCELMLIEPYSRMFLVIARYSHVHISGIWSMRKDRDRHLK